MGPRRRLRTAASTPSQRELLVAGVALYAGEGAKTDGSVRLANTNPVMIAFFCAWLRHFFVIAEERLRAQLYLHQGLDLAVAVHDWAEVTGIPSTQFIKPYRAVADGGDPPSDRAIMGPARRPLRQLATESAD